VGCSLQPGPRYFRPLTHSPSPLGSKFSVLDESPLEHLSQVASDSGVVFHGERGPQLAQIAVIKAREIYEGTLAVARAQAERERADPSRPARSGQSTPGSREGGSPTLGTEEATQASSRQGGHEEGLPRRRLGPRPLLGPDLSPVRGQPP
jgi:hypothetical protein